jgi:NDP-sugar pyrophosphorylase family protein
MIIFPMAGLSRRFFDAGYSIPKFMLPLGNETVFEHVVKNFIETVNDETFEFVTIREFGAEDFIKKVMCKNGVSTDRFNIYCLDDKTRGQAETVYLGLSKYRKGFDESLTIFNIDTIHKNYKKKLFLSEESKGYLEVLMLEGTHWSFVLPKDGDGFKSGSVSKVVEKDRISNYCSNGLYVFESIKLFNDLYCETYLEHCKKERYIAPMYQTGLDLNIRFDYHLLNPEDVDFCGTPSEYQNLVHNYPEMK